LRCLSASFVVSSTFESGVGVIKLFKSSQMQVS
jgi:hypothetical protein